MIVKELLDKIIDAGKENLPFVVYRPPGENSVEAWIQKDKALSFVKDYAESGFVMAHFDTAKKAILFAAQNVDRYQAEVISGEYTASVSSLADQEVPNGQDKQKHLDLVYKVLSKIEKGELVKTVLSRSKYVPLKALDVPDIFLKLIHAYPEAFAYIWYHPEIGLWAGASPETLVSSRGLQFNTMSLAGTQKYQGKIDVEWTEKEIKEQQIVTDHIVQVLSEYPLEISDRYTRKAGSLLHLCNDISGVLKSSDTLGNLISKLHPTPAVCGLPQNSARDFIIREEGYDRSFYTGFLGELNCVKKKVEGHPDAKDEVPESHLFVNLRCMQLISGPNAGAMIYIGGGVTADSDPVSEWEETVDKSMVMKSILLA